MSNKLNKGTNKLNKALKVDKSREEIKVNKSPYVIKHQSDRCYGRKPKTDTEDAKGFSSK